MTKSNNWMLDEVTETINSELSTEDLIKKLTIQKIEYGRMCIAQFLSMTEDKSNDEKMNYYYELDGNLEEKINEFGEHARQIKFILKK